MDQEFRERSHWLARNVLPHEPLIRSKLKKACVYDFDVEDVIQEMYARLLGMPSIAAIRYPRQYALLVAKGIVVDQIRRSRIVSITTPGDVETLDVVDPFPSEEERLQFKQEVEIVVDALNALPKACRDTLIMRRVEGLPQKEVARRLQVSEKMVEKHMTNSIRLLMDVFGRGRKSRVVSTSIGATTIEDTASEQD